MPLGPHFFEELRAAGLGDGVAVAGGKLRLSEALPQAAKDAVLARAAAHNPAPILFQGEAVASAKDVDRVTARRVRALLAPQWGGDAASALQAMLRKVEEMLAALYVIQYKAGATQAEKDAARTLLDADWALRSGQLQALRQEGESFKAVRGW
ncbi:MAG: hypothetical protein AABZ64_16795 [Nitrospinota bacterium]